MTFVNGDDPRETDSIVTPPHIFPPEGYDRTQDGHYVTFNGRKFNKNQISVNIAIPKFGRLLILDRSRSNYEPIN